MQRVVAAAAGLLILIVILVLESIIKGQVVDTNALIKAVKSKVGTLVPIVALHAAADNHTLDI